MPYQDVYDEVRNAFVNRQEAIRRNGVNARQDNANLTAGNQFASGDIPGAAQTLYKAGDISGGQQAQQYDDATRQKHAQAALRISQGIRAATAAGHTPQDAFAMATQIAPQLGIDPKDLANMKPAFDQNPQAFLDMVDQQAKKELQFFQTKGGIYAGDKNTGNVTLSKALPGEPIALDPGKNYYMPDNGSTPAAGATVQGAQGQPATPNADAVWQAMVQRESGGQPGVKGPMTPYGQAIGATQLLPKTAKAMADKLGLPFRMDLLTGASPQAAAYQEQLGRAYFDEGLQKYGGDVGKAAMYYHGGPNEAIWGPKTRAYAQAVTAGQPMAGGAGADTVGAPQIPGYRLLQQGDGQVWKPDGKGALINSRTGDRKKDPTFEGTAAAADPKVVQGLIEGRIAPPTQKAAATDYWQAQLSAAMEKDPTFDGVNFQARAKARADFTSGKSAQNITALNTVVGHLDTLDRTIDGLGNYSFKLNNQLAHGIADATGTNARIQNFETAKQAVATELTRVFRGTGGAEADIQSWSKRLDATGSPQALHSVVREMSELVNSRLEAIGEQYTQGMGLTKEPIRLLTPDKQKAFARLQGGAQPAASAPAKAAASTQVIRYDAQGRRIQ